MRPTDLPLAGKLHEGGLPGFLYDEWSLKAIDRVTVFLFGFQTASGFVSWDQAESTVCAVLWSLRLANVVVGLTGNGAF